MTAFLTLLALAVTHQEAPRRAAVKVEMAELRVMPSERSEYHVTNRVPKGTVLEVVGEADGGWLKVKPPVGSATWINARYLRSPTAGRDSPIISAEGETVPTYPGSAEASLGRRPAIVGARLKVGSLVRCLANPQPPDMDGTGSWVAIAPPPGEVRYVKASALEAGSATFTPASPGASDTGSAGAGSLPVARTPSANGGESAEELWKRAYSAHVSRRHEEAARYYEEAAAEASRSNPQLAAAASAQARALRAWLASNRTSSSFTASTATLSPPGESPRAQPVGAYRGTLRRAGRDIDGQRTYYLDVHVQGGLRLPGFYVTGGPGVDLAPFAGRDVQLSGTPLYRSDYRAYHLVAAHIQLYR